MSAALLVVALVPVGVSAQDGATEQGGGEVIDLGTSPIDPDPFGFCVDGTCSVSEPGLTKEDVLAVAPEAIFTDSQDPLGLVACFLGDGCQVLDASITLEDLEAVMNGDDGIVGAVDGNLTGTWSVTDHATRMVCRSGGKGAPIKIKRNRHEDTVERLENGRLLLSGSGFAEVISRLGPGVYGLIYQTREGGTRIETRAFIGMQDNDVFKGFSESRLKRKNGTCSMTRAFDGVRLSGPDIEIERGDTPDGGEPADGAHAENVDPLATEDPTVDSLPGEDDDSGA